MTAILPTSPGSVSSAPVGFLRACASAWVCIRRPAFLIPGFIAVALFAVLMVTGNFLSAARPGGSRMGDTPVFLADLAGPGALAEITGGMVSIVGSCVLAVAAAHISSAFSTGSIRVQMVRQPRRRLWLGGNLAVIAVLSAVLTLASVLSVVLTALAVAPIYGVPTGAWFTAAALGPLSVTTLNLAVCMVGFALLGATLALWLRSAIATIGVGLCYGLFEELIAGVFPEIARYFPAQNLAAMAQGGTEHVPYLWSVIGSVLVIAASVIVSMVTLSRRDIVD